MKLSSVGMMAGLLHEPADIRVLLSNAVQKLGGALGLARTVGDGLRGLPRFTPLMRIGAGA